jgi:hypothetical protein
MAYQERYNRFIESLRDQEIDGVYEVHHVVPRSLGGSDDKQNLIKLTPRQHYVAHWMLWKIHSGKMAQAFFFMNNLQYEQKLGGRAYQKLREEARMSISGENAYWYGKQIPADIRKRLSESRLRYMDQPGVREKYQEIMSNMRPTKETYQLISKTMSTLVWMNDGVRGYRVRPELVQDKLDSGLKLGRLMNHITDEYRSKLSEATANQWAAVKATGHSGHLIKV